MTDYLNTMAESKKIAATPAAMADFELLRKEWKRIATFSLEEAEADFMKEFSQAFVNCWPQGMTPPAIPAVPAVPTAAPASAPAGAKAKGAGKGLTGYNLFMRDKSAELKEQNVPGKDRLSLIGRMWKALDPEEQKSWNAKAKAQVGAEAPAAAVVAVAGAGVAAAEAPVKAKKLTSYNLFVREKMAELKEQNVPSGERMGKVADMWKELGAEGKKAWKPKA